MSRKRDKREKKSFVGCCYAVATALIVIVAVFFIVKLFTANPLEGTWKYQDGDLVLAIRGNNDMSVRLSGVYENSNIKIRFELYN